MASATRRGGAGGGDELEELHIFPPQRQGQAGGEVPVYGETEALAALGALRQFSKNWLVLLFKVCWGEWLCGRVTGGWGGDAFALSDLEGRGGEEMCGGGEGARRPPSSSSSLSCPTLSLPHNPTPDLFLLKGVP